jgi:hypothetical protein
MLRAACLMLNESGCCARRGPPTLAPPGWEGGNNENPPLPVEDWDAVKPGDAGAGGGQEGAPSYGQRGARGRGRGRGRGRHHDSPADMHDAGWDAQVARLTWHPAMPLSFWWRSLLEDGSERCQGARACAERAHCHETLMCLLR